MLCCAGVRTVIIEKHDPAVKIRITGKGRCNITNDCDAGQYLKNVASNPRFLYSSISAFPPASTMELMSKLGVALKTERGARVFPVSDSANTVADALIRYASGCTMLRGEAVEVEIENGAACGVKLSSGETVLADTVLLAAGGKSYPGTGSNGSGFTIAKKAGHTIVEPAAALCGLELAGGIGQELQGLALKNVRLTMEYGGKKIFSEQGEMEFTHFGISGPIVLSLSSRCNRIPLHEAALYIDFKPALSEQTLDARLLREFSGSENKELKTVLCELLPRALAPIAAERSGGNVKINALTAEKRRSVINTLKHFDLNPLRLRPIAEAIVTAGGVETKQIDPKTMQSKLVNGLYFAGEVIDVDGLTGGFNLQAAFCTAAAAARAIIKSVTGEQ